MAPGGITAGMNAIAGGLTTARGSHTVSTCPWRPYSPLRKAARFARKTVMAAQPLIVPDGEPLAIALQIEPPVAETTERTPEHHR
jgi:hypothetical protein